MATTQLFDRTLLVSETFYSIQGESSYAGYPCVFIRLAGCNLRCNFCDAGYTYEEPGEKRTIQQLIEFALNYPAALIEITGGEPLLQENVYPLMNEFLKSGRTVLLETNGSMDLGRVPEPVKKIMDLKCPDSGMHAQMNLGNIDYLSRNDEIKFVISSRHDYRWAVQTISTHRLLQRTNVLFSPVVTRMPPAELAGLILRDRLQARLQIQLHSLLWPDKKRGA